MPLTRPNRAKLSQPRKINVRLLPEATQQNWLATLGKAKDVAGATMSLAPTQTSQAMDTPPKLSPTSPVPSVKFIQHTQYCAMYTPLGKISLKEFPMSLDWDNDEVEEWKDHNKGEDQEKDSEKKTPQTNPRFFVATTLTPQIPKTSIEQFSKRSNVTPEKEEHRYKTMTLLEWHFSINPS